MASGYVTSDGKDLDQRYLAINGKAASATNSDWAANAGHANTAGGLSSPIAVKRTGNTVYASVYVSGVNSYRFPCSGVARVVSTSRITVNFCGIQKIPTNVSSYSNVHCFFANTGDTVSFNNEGDSGYDVFISTTPVST